MYSLGAILFIMLTGTVPFNFPSERVSGSAGQARSVR